MDDTNYDLNKSISRLESESQKELAEFAYEPEQTLINSIHVDQVSNLSETEKNEAKDEQEQAEDEEPLNDTIIGGNHGINTEVTLTQLKSNESTKKARNDLHIEMEYYNRKRMEEEYQKELYYRSNPLRKFVGSSQGQSILPPKNRIYSNKKKGMVIKAGLANVIV